MKIGFFDKSIIVYYTIADTLKQLIVPKHNGRLTCKLTMNSCHWVPCVSSSAFHWPSVITSGYATMVHGWGCNPHRCMTTFTNLEITSFWRHWWRHNSETIRDREKRRPPHAMKSSELSSGENRIALRQLLQNRKWRHNLGSTWKLQKMARENFSIGALYDITN